MQSPYVNNHIGRFLFYKKQEKRLKNLYHKRLPRIFTCRNTLSQSQIFVANEIHSFHTIFSWRFPLFASATARFG